MERMEVELPIQNMRLVAIPEIFGAQTSEFVSPERCVSENSHLTERAVVKIA